MGYPLKEITVTSPFGKRNLAGMIFHNGVDFRASTGTPCYAIADGIVRISQWNPTGYGHFILIQHDGFCTLYAHFDRAGLRAGTVVKEGDIVGFAGNTGISFGSHLHFEIREGVYVPSTGFFSTDSQGKMPFVIDPMVFLNSMNKPPKVDNDLNRALKLLVDKGVINSPAYWRDMAVEGKNPRGDYVGLIIKRFADIIRQGGL